LVKVGYVFDTHLGGGVVSPVLYNLVLHELDCFIGKLITSQGSQASLERGFTRGCLRLENRLKDTMPIDTRGAGFAMKQYYVRHVGEFLIGLSCLRPQTVIQLKLKIKEFLNNELLLELKILTAKAEISKVEFLETDLSSVSSVRGRAQVPSVIMKMNAPYHLLINKLIDKGIVKMGRVAGGKTGIVPQPILKFVNLPINEIILRYQAILNEVFNYYSFVDNRPKLIVVYWILRKSLAKTLATKLRLKTSRQVYLKFGINIKYTIPHTLGEFIDFARPSLAVRPKNFIRTTGVGNPMNLSLTVTADGLKIITNNAFGIFSTHLPPPQAAVDDYVGRLKVMNGKLNKFESQRLYSTVAGSSKTVHPFFITGFSGAEACFSISIIKDSKTKTG
jgi:hypothetical protein